MMQHPFQQEPRYRMSPNKTRQTRVADGAKTGSPAKPRSSPVAAYAGGAYNNAPTAESLPAPTFEEGITSPKSKIPIESLFLDMSGIDASPSPAPSTTAAPSSSPAPASSTSPVAAPPTPTSTRSPPAGSPMAAPLMTATPTMTPVSRVLFPPVSGVPPYFAAPQPMLAYPPAMYPAPSTSLPPYHAHQPSSPQPRFDTQASAHLRAVLKIQS